MCAVQGSPSGPFISSALPWSAVIRILPPISPVAFTILPIHLSTVSMAFIAAAILPVCPTISGLAKFITTKEYCPVFIAFEQLIVNSSADISGAIS